MNNLIIGIAGGSGSGKTTLALRLKERFGEDEVRLISHDSYYKRHDDLPFEERCKLTTTTRTLSTMPCSSTTCRSSRPAVPSTAPYTTTPTTTAVTKCSTLNRPRCSSWRASCPL